MLKQYVTYNNNRTANIFYIYLTYKLCILYNLSQEEIAFLVREAQYHNLTVIPLVQTFGHLEVSIKTFTNNSSKTICCLLEWEINLYKKYTNHNLIKSTFRVCCSSPRLTLRSFFFISLSWSTISSHIFVKQQNTPTPFVQRIQVRGEPLLTHDYADNCYSTGPIKLYTTLRIVCSNILKVPLLKISYL